MSKKFKFRMRPDWISFLYIAILAFFLISWVRCITMAVTRNWEPIGKAEVAYTIGCVIPPASMVIAWIDIEDK